MTDFLSRLVDRALGEAPVAQPLIAPFFAQGAEIFGPDATPFVVTQTEPHQSVDEHALDSVSSDAPVTTASLQVKKTQRSEMKREEAETDDETPIRFIRTESRQSVDEPALDSVSYDTPLATPSPPVEATQRAEMNRKQAETHSAERKESSKISKDPAPKAEPRHQSLRERQRAKAGSEPASYSETHKSLASSPSPDRAAENPPASLRDRKGETRSPDNVSTAPDVFRSTEPKIQQSLRAKEHDLSAGIESLQSEQEVQQMISQVVRKRAEVRPTQVRPAEIRPGDEMRKGTPLSEGERTSVESRGNAVQLEIYNAGEQGSVTPHPDSNARQNERPSSVLASGARNSKQRTSGHDGENQHAKSAGGKEHMARQAASVSEESVTPVSAAPVKYDSGAAMIVRPGRITARGRADSHSRATGEESTPSMQTAHTIKVTIGRIEVRAILPPAPREQKTAQPAPRMSLDDYLKSHSGGGR